MGFKINLGSHHNIHANSKLTITTNYREFRIKVRSIIKFLKELSVIYGRLFNQYIFKYQTIFSARFDKENDDTEVKDETELFNNIKIDHNLTMSDLDNIAIKSPLEHQIQQQEMKDSGWRFDKLNSLIIYFYKTGEMDGRSYNKNPMKSSSILNVEKTINIVSHGQK